MRFSKEKKGVVVWGEGMGTGEDMNTLEISRGGEKEG